MDWLHPWDVLVLRNIPRHPGCNTRKEIPAPELDSAGDHQLSHFRLKNAETILSTSKQQPHPKNLPVLCTPCHFLPTLLIFQHHLQGQGHSVELAGENILPENGKKNHLMTNNGSYSICTALPNSQSAFFININSLTSHHHPLLYMAFSPYCQGENQNPERLRDLSKKDATSKWQVSVSTGDVVTKTEVRTKMHSLSLSPKAHQRELCPQASPVLCFDLDKLRHLCRHFILKPYFYLRQRPNHQLGCSQLCKYAQKVAGLGSRNSTPRPPAEALLENPGLMHPDKYQGPARYIRMCSSCRWFQNQAFVSAHQWLLTPV